MEKFIIKKYINDGRSAIKGNGFDELEIGNVRIEAEKFVDFLNKLVENFNITKEENKLIDLTVKEIQEKKRLLEATLRHQINAFEKETNIFVNDIYVKREHLFGTKIPRAVNVIFKCEI